MKSKRFSVEQISGDSVRSFERKNDFSPRWRTTGAINLETTNILDCARVIRNGAPDRSRTSDLCLRRAALYPAELRAHFQILTSNHCAYLPNDLCLRRAVTVNVVN